MEKSDSPKVDSAAKPVQEEKRIAKNGRVYTESEFAEYYGNAYHARWEESLPPEPAVLQNLPTEASLECCSAGTSSLSSVVKPAQKQMLASTVMMQRHIMHPLRKAITGKFPKYTLPQSLTVNGLEIPLHSLHDAYDVNWSRILDPTNVNSAEIVAWKVAFFEEEIDSTPPFAKDTPRLDFVVTLTDGKEFRWHPKSLLIWGGTKTDAMDNRMRRKAKLLKKLTPPANAAAMS